MVYKGIKRGKIADWKPKEKKMKKAEPTKYMMK